MFDTWVGETPWHFISAVTLGLFQSLFLGINESRSLFFEASLKIGRLIFIWTTVIKKFSLIHN